jgi:hypothetical protein
MKTSNPTLQFSLLRSILGAMTLAAVLLTLPKWIGPAATVFLVGMVFPPLLIVRFRTAGFLIGLIIAWPSVSLGMQMQQAANLAAGIALVVPGEAMHETLRLWLTGLVLVYLYLAPIYLARALFDYRRIRSRLHRKADVT